MPPEVACAVLIQSPGKTPLAITSVRFGWALRISRLKEPYAHRTVVVAASKSIDLRLMCVAVLHPLTFNLLAKYSLVLICRYDDLACERGE